MQPAAVRRRRPSFLAIPRLENIEEIDFGDDLESIFDWLIIMSIIVQFIQTI